MVSTGGYSSPTSQDGFVAHARMQARAQRRRQLVHARLGVATVVLLVMVVLLAQAFAGGSEGALKTPEPSQASAAVSPFVTHMLPTQPPATVTPSPTAPIQQAAIVPSPPAFIPTVTPTVEPVVVVEEPIEPATATAESAVETVASTADATEPAGDDVAASDPEPETAQGALPVPILDEAWEAAIHTWDGGVMGMVVSAELNVRAAPSADAEIVATTWMWRPVVIYDTVEGDWVGETNVWYALGVGQFVSAAFVDPFIPALPETTQTGTWVDVNLSTGYAVAYQDTLPVYAALVGYGKPGFETPLGEHTIFARVESDTLDSSTIGIPDGDTESYLLTDVPHVQYFAEGGFALHGNYWDEAWEFGGPTSHGCVNLTPADAAFFWNFLDIGSVVSVRE